MTEKLKELDIDFDVHGNQEGARIVLTESLADKALALYQTALESILKDIPEEDHCHYFDKWLKEQDEELYTKVKNGTFEAMATEMLSDFEASGYNYGLTNVHRDADSVYWSESDDEILLEAITEHKK